jgi:predicted nucleic acid-binding protein
MSLVSFGEFDEGISYGRDPTAQEHGSRLLLRWMDVLPLHCPILRRSARIRGDLRRQGRLIGDPDILIAATALHERPA